MIDVSNSKTVKGLTCEFTPNGLNIHGTAEQSLGAVVELAPLLTDNKICLPDGFYLYINKKLPSGCSIGIWDDASNPFSVNRYLNIPEDTDYLTLQFGLNESNIANEPSTLGTSTDSDNTTMWGAYNTVFEWILTNRPNAKVGVIITDSWMTENYANALIEICKFWGVPWLDLGGDPQVSLNIGGRRLGSGITLSETAKSLRNKQFQINTGNMHPNGAGNRWRYTALQEFMRRL